MGLFLRLVTVVLVCEIVHSYRLLDEIKKEYKLRNLLNKLKKNIHYYRDDFEEKSEEELSVKDAIERYLDKYNVDALNLQHKTALAEWNSINNITDTTAQQLTEASMKELDYDKKQCQKASKLLNLLKKSSAEQLSSEDYRQLKLISACDILEDPKLDRKLIGLVNKFSALVSSSKVNVDGKELEIEPGLTKLFSTSRDYDKLVEGWWGWRNQTGRKMRPDAQEFFDLQNVGAKSHGYKDEGSFMRVNNFEMDEDLVRMAESLLNEIMPFYRQLHAFVRRRLIQKYPGRGIQDRGTIPAHLLGNMWAQQWHNIMDLVTPFPNIKPFDLTVLLKSNNFTVHRMFKTAEDFYTSIGLFPMTEKFWNNSVFTKPIDRYIQCHGSANDLYAKDDYRIMMCTEVTQSYFTTVHHEMGHIEYFMSYASLPVMFRNGACAAFHEAIGDTVALFVMTPEHAATIGLADRQETDTDPETRRKQDINYLMRMALEKLAFIPFGFLIDKYRWDIYSGRIKPYEYNRKWWEYRIHYQGISPPVLRSEEDFDAGAKYHVAANVGYIRYFFSFIVQFQFHKALCDIKGYKGEIYKCDIYGSEDAGRRYKEMLSKGRSQPWSKTLKELTGKDHFSAAPFLEFFKPLREWLKKENGDETVGWEANISDYFTEDDNLEDFRNRILGSILEL